VRVATVRIQRDDFDAGAEAEALARGRTDVGAVSSFVGYCRDEGGRLAALELEHYSGMAEEEIARAAREAEARWPLIAVTVIHRYGKIAPGERIVLVAVAAAHRGPAFAAAEMLMDYLKTRAPFWKRVIGVDSAAEGWVEAKADDERSAARWGGADGPRGSGA
jgi:molybdopterin synthase catalytic subunit